MRSYAIKRSLFAAGIAMASFGHASALEPTFVISMRTSKISEADVRRAVQIFWRNCQPLSSYTSDIKQIAVDVSDEWADFRLARGWKISIEATVRVPDDPKEIPRYDPRVHVISGNNLFYNIGGGATPGFTSGKRAAQLLCGLPITQNGSDTFKAVPELDFIKY
ncbi:hypothetical protein [Methylobacterium sp. SD21]|uniref:hypothetical protein n=1 Tax=Methylobacterium litchii TaxID=3138810 RepID=UPI00313EA616